MKVLHLSSAATWRGGEAQAFHLIQGLARKGHAVVLAAPGLAPLAVRCGAAGCPVAAVAIRSDADLPSFWRVKGIIAREKPDVVHCHDGHAHTAGVVSRWLGAAGRLVVSRRVSYPPRPHFLNALKYGCRVDRFIAVSGEIARQLADLGVGRDRVRTVRSGIDVERFHRPADVAAWKAAHGLPPDKALVGVVASLAPQKEQDVFLRAAARLLERRGDAHFVLAGEGERRPVLEALAARLGLGDRVTFTGFLEDVVPAVQALSVAVLPSGAGEGSPAAVKEAVACGVPVVAVDEPNVREIVEDGVTALLVPPRDPGALADALDRLLSDAALGRRLAGNARRLEPSFGLQAMVEGTERVYRELTGP